LREGLEAEGVSPTRPHGRRDELRAARRVLLDQTASLEARGAALETLAGLLKATRSNGRPAYSLRLEAAKALLANPILYDPRLWGLVPRPPRSPGSSASQPEHSDPGSD
jgi:hypothetical protein